jgi:hypothetical protein
MASCCSLAEHWLLHRASFLRSRCSLAFLFLSLSESTAAPFHILNLHDHHRFEKESSGGVSVCVRHAADSTFKFPRMFLQRRRRWRWWWWWRRWFGSKTEYAMMMMMMKHACVLLCNLKNLKISRCRHSSSNHHHLHRIISAQISEFGVS